MPGRLYAGRFENDFDSANILESWEDPEDIGIRWSLDNFGIERVEVTIRVSSLQELYDRQNNHLGQRIGIYSEVSYRPMTGTITAISPVGSGRVKYIGRGPRWHARSELIRETYPTGEDTDVRITNLLTDYMSTTVSLGNEKIASTGVDAGAFQPDWPRGSYPDELIDQYRGMSNSSNQVMDFWLLDQPFVGPVLQKYQPWFQPRQDSPDPEWVVSINEMRFPRITRSIDNYASHVIVFYGTYTGTVSTQDVNGINLLANMNFTGNGVVPGDDVINITDGSRAKVKVVNGGSDLDCAGDGLIGGTDNQFDVSDIVAIQRHDAWYNDQSDATTPLFTREHVLKDKRYTLTQAQAIGDAYLDFYSTGVQEFSFTITSPTIRNFYGARWPLWEMIAQGGGKLRVNDLYPAAAVLDNTLDTLTTFQITAMDYDYRTNRLQVHVDTPDGRLDARLKKAGLLGGELIARGIK